MSECRFFTAYVMRPTRWVHAKEVRWCWKHSSTCPPKGRCHKARADEAEAALARVRELHRPMPVCPEAEGEWFPDHCPCDDWSRHYQVCEACCVDASDCTTEDCATCHDHGPDKPICPTMQALDGGAA